MASYRFTFTGKWEDAWFLSLKPNSKLLFNFMCDNCDTAGFIEINTKLWAPRLGFNEATTKGALEGLKRGLIYSASGDCAYLRTFLKHQKNLPLNPEKNMCHRGIIKCFENYKYKFQIEDIDQFIEGALKGLQSPYGIGKGNSSGSGTEKREVSEREKQAIEEFEKFRSQYPGSKRGFEPEFDNFKKKYKNWKEITPLLLPNLQQQILWRAELKAKGVFVPIWKNMQTYLNNQCWTEEINTKNTGSVITSEQPYKVFTYEEITELAEKHGAGVWNKYKAVTLNGRTNKVWISIDDIKTFNLIPVETFSKTA